MEMAEKGHFKLKCPKKVDPTTKNPYPEGRFVQCQLCFKAPCCIFGYINLHTCFNQTYWDYHTNGNTHKLVVQINEHNKEQVKMGKT